MIIGDFMQAFQKGKQLANSATWKNRQLAAGALVTFFGAFLSIAKAVGYDIPIDQDTLVAFCGGIAALYGVFNAIVTATTSAKVGLPASSPPPTEPSM